MDKYLNNINSPKDLRALSSSECVALCEEIREFLIKNVEHHGGHLASNLGVVELTVALHRVFDSPNDRIIFDTGHQSYVHKMLTGRKAAFNTLRAPGGLSGFTSRRESRHDPFGAGHCSTSLSAALGFAVADALNGDTRHTVCVIGDGAYTGGMIHEALNNCDADLPLVIILNENGMSISANTGAFADYLSKAPISSKQAKRKSEERKAEYASSLGDKISKLIFSAKDKISDAIRKKNYFEQLGLCYIGPIDGHDIEKCENALKEAASLGRAVVVHLRTIKGKGYAKAEKAPDAYHSLGSDFGSDTFHSVLAEELVKEARSNENVVAVSAAMGKGTGLLSFAAEFPERYFDVGIAEPHAVTFAAGLAAAGKLPFVGVYSTFLQRSYDSILHDVALQSLPVKLLIDRAGLATGDGATHHGIFDVAFLSHIPGVALLAPVSYESLRRAMKFAIETPVPVAIRYPNSSEIADFESRFRHIGGGVSVDFDTDRIPDLIFVTYGKITENVISAAEIIKARGVDCGIAVTEILSPISEPHEALMPVFEAASRVVFVEEGIRRGGVGEALCAKLSEQGSAAVARILAIDDNFASPDSPCDLYEYVGLDPVSIAKAAMGGVV